MSLRARLVVALLALALLPTIVFTLFTLVELDRATERWFRPGVDRALESALQVSRVTVVRMEATVRARAGDWARFAPAGPLNPGARLRLAHELDIAGLDFVQVYARSDSGWTQVDQALPVGILEARGEDLADELESALQGDRVIRSLRGAVAGVAPLGERHALVAGMWVPPDFFRDVEQVSEGRGLYSRLGVMVDVQRPFTGLLVAALVLVLVALALLLSQALAKPLAQPLVTLATALDRVAAGDLEVRVTPRGPRELRSLAGAFNSMTARLEEARAALARAEREAAWREVARKLAHEFKNILTPLQLSLQILEDDLELLPGERRAAARENLGAALGEAQQLALLAGQFSQYARLPEPRLEPLDLAAVARSATARPMCDGVTLACEAPEPVPVRGDPVLLARAVHNLVLNACEASPAGGRVEVSARRAGGEGVLEVLDRGPGVPAELAGRLFEPYVSTKRRGSGLGLSLVRDIVLQHGGSVTLENRAEGGAHARLALPLDMAEARG